MQNTQETEDAAPACMFCGHTDTKHVLYGQFLEKRAENFAVHQSCLMFSCGSGIKNKKKVSLNDVLIRKIRRMVTQAEERACTVCNIGGATVTCCHKKCTERIHYPCGLDSEFIFQHFGTYKTYCLKHRPVQRIQPGNEDPSCAICLDELTPAPGYYVLKPPCCEKQWMHRACLQTLALNAGKRCLRCPICKNQRKFCRELQRLGIYVPDREPSWEQKTSNQPPAQGRWECEDSSCSSYDDSGEGSSFTGSSQSSPRPSTSGPSSLPSRRRRSSDLDTEKPPAKKQKF